MSEIRQKNDSKIIGTAYKVPKELVKKYAKQDIPILLAGDTGSGKELFARLYMDTNTRRGHKQTINCAAFTDSLLRSEIFGHIRGAFTGAEKNREGILRKCDKGILFLDEIGASTKEFQAAILRVVEMNGFTPVGSDEEIHCNTRIIAATNDLNKVREDLKYRFNILPIPPLQKFDIPLIAEYHLKRKLKRNVINELMLHRYSGNVRELIKNCDRLFIEKGDNIFGKDNDDNSARGTNLFEYERFRFEYLAWQEHIQPILESLGIREIKYRYTEIRSESPFSKRGFSGKPLFVDPWGKEGEDPELCDIEEIARMLRKLKYDTQNHLLAEKFCENLKSLMDRFELPHLLLKLNGDNGQNGFEIAYPMVHNLLFTKPPNRAKMEFERIYIEYYLNKNNNNIKKTAEELSVNYNTLRSRIQALDFNK
jgi:DNA-binding NtrC family response regulator